MGHALDTLPKIDLCCHLDGALPWAGAETTDLETARARVREGLRTPVDFRVAAQTLGIALQDQAVMHVELHVDLAAWPLLPAIEILEAIDAGLQGSLADGDPGALSWSLLPEFARTCSAADAEALVERLVSAELPRVTGVAVAAEQQPGQSALHLKGALNAAREAGLGRVVATDRGRSLLAEALELGAQRIIGGSAALEDPDLLLQLRAHRLPIVVCPSAQVHVGVARDIASLRLARMAQAGLFLTLGSGWPTWLGTSIGAEYQAMAQHHHWRLDDVRNATARGIEAALTDPARRFQLARTVEVWRHRPMAGPGPKGDNWSL